MRSRMQNDRGLLDLAEKVTVGIKRETQFLITYRSESTQSSRLPGKGNSNSHGARPATKIITMMKWIRTTRLTIENSPSKVTRTRRLSIRNSLVRAGAGFRGAVQDAPRPVWKTLVDHAAVDVPLLPLQGTHTVFCR